MSFGNMVWYENCTLSEVEVIEDEKANSAGGRKKQEEVKR